jgi:hypothetical protein
MAVELELENSDVQPGDRFLASGISTTVKTGVISVLMAPEVYPNGVASVRTGLGPFVSLTL